MKQLERIQKIVNNLVTEHETRDPFRLAKQLGASILFVPLVKVNGFYQWYQSSDLIYINENLTKEEQILVCAHELGHMILHNNVNTIFLESFKHVTNKFETEANDFAFLLLKDKLNFKEEINMLNLTYENYQKRYKNYM